MDSNIIHCIVLVESYPSSPIDETHVELPRQENAKSYILSVVRVHTTTHCMFYREQHRTPHLLKSVVLEHCIVLVESYPSSPIDETHVELPRQENAKIKRPI
jgi:hypothetical protein